MSKLSKPRVLVEDREPWTKQPWESIKAFEAFALYRDLGETRSIAKVAAQTRKGEGMIATWSTRNLWQVRVTAYHEHSDRRRLEHKELLRQQIDESDIAFAEQLLRLSRNSTDVMDQLGAGLPLEQIPAFAALAIKTRRLAAGMATDHSKTALQITMADLTKVVGKIVDIACDGFVPPERQEDFIRRVMEEAA